MTNPNKEMFRNVDKQIIAEKISALRKEMPEMSAEIQKIFDVVIELIAEALCKASDDLKIPARNFQLSLSADVDGFIQHAKFRVIDEQHFIVLLSLDRIMYNLELMRSSPFRRPEFLKSLIADVGHEMYHGFQLIYARNQLVGIPSPDDDFNTYATNEGEQKAEEYGKLLGEFIASQPNFFMRLL